MPKIKIENWWNYFAMKCVQQQKKQRLDAGIPRIQKAPEQKYSQGTSFFVSFSYWSISLSTVLNANTTQRTELVDGLYTNELYTECRLIVAVIILIPATDIIVIDMCSCSLSVACSNV